MSESPQSRRWFLGWMSRLGVGAIAVVAGVTATQQPAAANGFCNCTPYCCCLKTCKSCSGSGHTFTCPSGWTKRVWYCCIAGNHMYGCGECLKGGSSCWDGDEYTCSETWYAGSNCLTLSSARQSRDQQLSSP